LITNESLDRVVLYEDICGLQFDLTDATLQLNLIFKFLGLLGLPDSCLPPVYRSFEANFHSNDERFIEQSLMERFESIPGLFGPHSLGSTYHFLTHMLPSSLLKQPTNEFAQVSQKVAAPCQSSSFEQSVHVGTTILSSQQLQSITLAFAQAVMLFPLNSALKCSWVLFSAHCESYQSARKLAKKLLKVCV
jgi:hypothetical protein